MNIYEKIKTVAEEKCLSIQEIEKRSVLANGSVSKWSTSMPKADSLYKVAKVLERPIEYFLTDEVEFVGKVDVSAENELLQNYRKLDSRGRHRLHTITYEELDRIDYEAQRAEHEKSKTG